MYGGGVRKLHCVFDMDSGGLDQGLVRAFSRENASEPMWFRGVVAFIVGYYSKIFFRSSSGVLIGAML